jgi:hypothetical protein
MRRLIPLAWAALIIALGVVFYQFVPKQPTPAVALAPPATANGQDATDLNQLIAEVNKQGGGSVIIQDGKVTLLGFGMSGAENVDVHSSISGREGKVSGAVLITIKSERPPVVTKEGFERIRAGMTYPQVAEALGGEMTKGRMGDGFSGGFGIVQGGRRIDLTFVDSKVTDRSAKGLE